MNRVEFKRLDIIQQIDFFNNELLKDKTITEISKEIGIGKANMRKEVEAAGYVYNAKTKQYISITTPIKNICRYDEVMKILETMDLKINKVYSWYENEGKCGKIMELKINKFNGTTTNRTYKFDSEVQEDFKNFCEAHNIYKVQDLVSQALFEFMEKYK